MNRTEVAISEPELALVLQKLNQKFDIVQLADILGKSVEWVEARMSQTHKERSLLEQLAIYLRGQGLEIQSSADDLLLAGHLQLRVAVKIYDPVSGDGESVSLAESAGCIDNWVSRETPEERIIKKLELSQGKE